MKRIFRIILVWCLITFTSVPQAWALAPQTGIQQNKNKSLSQQPANTFLNVIDRVRKDLHDGQFGTVVLGSNIRIMNMGMEALYERSDAYLNTVYDADNISVIRNLQRPEERLHDLPGGMGIIERVSGELGAPWVDSVVLMVTDGGFKQRFAYKILSEGYAGLAALPGTRYENLREAAFINTLAIMQYLPNGPHRFLGWSASDNFVFLGEAGIGGIPITDSDRLRDRVQDASIVKCGAKVTLLNESDLRAIRESLDMPDLDWTDENIVTAIGQDSWNRIVQQIEGQKLTQLGILAIDKEGRLVAFFEKVKEISSLVRHFYKYGGTLYKNPFIELLDKRFAGRLLERLKIQVAKTKGIGTLDLLPVSFMQTIYQSRFLSNDLWMKVWKDSGAAARGIHEDDWRLIKRVVDEVFEEEKREGRGAIYVIDFGEGYHWVDVGNLNEWMRFLSDATRQPEIRRSLNILEGSNLDPSSVWIDPAIQKEISDKAYLERTIITGGGNLLIEDDVLLSSVFLKVPAGTTLHIPRGTKIIESDLRDIGELHIEQGALIERVFPEGGDKLFAREDERITVLKVDENIVQARNLLSVPFTEKKIRDIIASREEWQRLQSRHPEYLAEFQYALVEEKQFIELPDPNLNWMTFSEAQRRVDYLWVNDRVRRFHREIDHEIDAAGLERLLRGVVLINTSN